MNDSMSVLLATTILALGGLGLYMYRTSQEEQDGGDNPDRTDTHNDTDNDADNDNDNDESIFGLSLFNWGGSEDNKDKEKHQDGLLDEELDETEVKTRKRTTVKTQRNRKPSSSSRRRY